MQHMWEDLVGVPCSDTHATSWCALELGEEQSLQCARK